MAERLTHRKERHWFVVWLYFAIPFSVLFFVPYYLGWVKDACR